ncbi:MAG: polynucleotide adenylyltransferase PcnB [Legionellaceae bacterium]|nr:polynucleotide adenylyltransferase PcnB [Legionellaceae bacterium]
MRHKKSKRPDIHSDYIIPRNQHHLSKTEISPNALTVLNRLNGAGFDAYLVGGSVRDLLLRKAPKDFDISTNATPNQIRKLFKNARIIGRRFKLVHILYHREIIEVATFRGNNTETQQTEQRTNAKGMLVRDNVYGNLEEDAWRRDFTINSLYYDVRDSAIIDYTGGFEDVRQKQIRMIGDPSLRYQEDPVRILRAIRFSAKLDFNIEPHTAAPIETSKHLLEQVAGSRLFDEITKLYQCGLAKKVQNQLEHYKIFGTFFPQTHALFNTNYPVKALLDAALESTDTRVQNGKPVIPSFLFAALLWFPFLQQKATLEAKAESEESEFDALAAVEKSMGTVLREQCKIITVPKRHTQVIREIWLFQYRLQKRNSKRAQDLLEHPRFRAAYDFLGLRALAGDESIELAEWWTAFQDAPPKVQNKMLAEQRKKNPQARKPRKKKKST